MTHGRMSWWLVATLLLAACSGGAGPGGAPTPAPSPGASAPAVNPFLTEAYNALPECPPPPASADVPQVDGLHLPQDVVITSSRENGPLTQVQGFVAMTPIQFRLYYQGRDDLEVIHLEDEGFEAEILVSDGTNRMFAKAQAFCSRGSNMVAIVAPESEADAVPVPALSPTPASE